MPGKCIVQCTISCKTVTYTFHMEIIHLQVFFPFRWHHYCGFKGVPTQQKTREQVSSPDCNEHIRALRFSNLPMDTPFYFIIDSVCIYGAPLGTQKLDISTSTCCGANHTKYGQCQSATAEHIEAKSESSGHQDFAVIIRIQTLCCNVHRYQVQLPLFTLQSHRSNAEASTSYEGETSVA